MLRESNCKKKKKIIRSVWFNGKICHCYKRKYFDHIKSVDQRSNQPIKVRPNVSSKTIR